MCDFDKRCREYKKHCDHLNMEEYEEPPCFDDKTLTAQADPVATLRHERGVSCAVMVREYLEKNGYDGLVEYDGECGCSLDDLMPCDGEGAMQCEAGHKTACTCGDGCDYHIVSGKKVTASS